MTATTRTDWLLFTLLGFLIAGGIALVNSRIGLGRFRLPGIPSPATGDTSDAN